MRWIPVSAVAAILFVCSCQQEMTAERKPPMTTEQRQEYAQKLKEILPDVPAFTAWQDRTHELPPDFNSLPKINNLPDPLQFVDGKTRVKSPVDWPARRTEILALFEKYEIGSIPPKPKLDKIVSIDPAQAAAEAAARGGRGFGGRGPATGPAGRGRGFARGPAPAEGSVTKIADLYYGPNSQIVTRVTVTIPPGTGPFPVLIGGTPGITSRGYISCSLNTSVDPPGAPNLSQYYPDYDFGTMGQTAFTMQMAVDYLYTLSEVDKPHIAITGYSRGGKMATIAAALDERITACVAGSTGVGGVLPWRLSGEKNVGESIESTTRMFPTWFNPRFRYFAGREDRLPIDGNLLADLVAPRSILMLYGLNDEVSNTWGNEECFYDTQKLFSFLGQPDHVSILRPPGHHGANDQEAVMNWLDIQFSKSKEKWKNDTIFPWDYSKWAKTASSAKSGPVSSATASRGDAEKNADTTRKAVNEMLGSPPPMSARANEKVTNPGDGDVDDTPRWVIGRSIIEHGWTRQQAAGIAARDIRFGVGDIRADVYSKESTPPEAKLPAVIFLHGNSYPLGYMFVYRTDPHPIIALANAGYAVFAYDQTGFGSRMKESGSFYDRYPQWSQMGRMVEDARALVEAARKDPHVDPEKIYLFGYGLGGTVALYTAALEPNVKGVVSICGFTPLRTDAGAHQTGEIWRMSEERGIIPRLGLYKGQESKIPYDYEDVISAIAPRPVYLLAPTMNRDANPADVRDAVAAARKTFDLYTASDKLMFDEPWDYFRLSLPAQDRIVQWMSQNMH